jgi:hypothetical protein
MHLDVVVLMLPKYSLPWLATKPVEFSRAMIVVE